MSEETKNNIVNKLKTVKSGVTTVFVISTGIVGENASAKFMVGWEWDKQQCTLIHLLMNAKITVTQAVSLYGLKIINTICGNFKTVDES